jgi:predicted dehydrogenase
VTAPRELRIGMVGAGRSRNGLGPFVARAFELAGARVVAVSGRDPARAAANAMELGKGLGHAVAAAPDAVALCRAGLDALAVTSPQEHHLQALQAALAAGIPCLCEKPLVGDADVAQGLAAAAAFAQRGLLLAENCQWPLVLPAIDALHGPLRGPARRVAMGLSPIGIGARTMVRDTLSHLLSVVQAVAGAPAVTGATAELQLRDVELDDRSDQALACTLRLSFVHRGGDLHAELQLRHCEAQPRPAWVEVDGRRVDRRIGSGYAIAFAGGGREVAVADPMHELVAAFVADLRQRSAETARRSATVIAARLRLYGEVLQAAR